MTHRRTTVGWLVLPCLVLAARAAAGATTLSFQEGLDGYAGTRDTTLDEAAPDTARGDETSFVARTLIGESAFGLIAFDAIIGPESGRIPAGAAIESAELILDLPASLLSTSSALHRALVSWTEADTWNGSFGGDGVGADDVEASATPDATIDAAQAGSITLDVTAAVQAWADGAANNGWALIAVAGSGGERSVSSSEALATEARPLLRVTFAFGPALDIKPGSCPNPFNTNSHGYLPVALLGTDDFDIEEIDIATITMSRADGTGGSVAPNEGPLGPHSVVADVGTPFEGEACACHDLGCDGIDDLKLKFKRQEIVDALELESLSAGTEVAVVVEGATLGGVSFSATDCLSLVGGGNDDDDDDHGDDNDSSDDDSSDDHSDDDHSGGWPAGGCSEDDHSSDDHGDDDDSGSTPNGLCASNGTSASHVLLSWFGVSAAQSYQVWRAPAGGAAAPLGTCAGTTGWYLDQSVQSGATYVYWVRAKVSGVWGAFSEPDQGYAASPVGPAALTASNGTSASHVLLSWQPANGASYYEVWRAPTGGQPTAIGTSTGPAIWFIDGTSPPGAPCNYWVRARLGAAWSAFGAPDMGWRGAASAPPAAPTGLVATNGQPNWVLLSWHAAAGATQHQVWRWRIGSQESPASVGMNVNGAIWFIDDTALPGVSYRYWVRSRSGAGWGTFSVPETGTRGSP